MKKLLFIIPFWAFPLTAMAQDKPTTHYTPEFIKTVVDRFAPAFCTGEPEVMVKAVKECYLTTPPEDQKRLQCFLADSLLAQLAYQGRYKVLQLGIDEANPFRDIQFTTASAYGNRTRALEQTPGFEYVRKDQPEDLLQETSELMHQTSYCEHNK